MVLIENDIVRGKILNIEKLQFKKILLIHLPNMWNNFDYLRNLIDVNYYHETSL